MKPIDFSSEHPQTVEARRHRQWIVANGLGGYACGTLAGGITWRYHGLLVAALPAPLGRTVMLRDLAESLVPADSSAETVLNAPTEFRLDHHLPVWRYAFAGGYLEKKLLLPHGQNTVHCLYALSAKCPPCRLHLRPWMDFRTFEADPGPVRAADFGIQFRGKRCEIHGPHGFPPLRLRYGEALFRFVADGGSIRSVTYPRDVERGMPAEGELWSPGSFEILLQPGEIATLSASTEDWHVCEPIDPAEAWSTEAERRARLLRIAPLAVQTGLAAALVLAADQFLFTPVGRVGDAARARAAGDEPRSVIAGYPWFGDWGRDTMISLEGLTVATGRLQEAKWILRTFARHIRDGLIPNLFPEGRNEGLYHTADATLWYFHAIERYWKASGDQETLLALLPGLRDIIAHHVAGTRFGIGVDPADSLLREGEPGYQLTWMDAKVGDWVVTPRRGKPVEINALWYNALKLAEGWFEPAYAAELGSLAQRVKDSFNRRFWNEAGGCLYDVLDGEKGGADATFRPNQILSFSLTHPVLQPDRWARVLAAVESKLLTPVGLRSLSADHPDYKPIYTGDLRSRDAAYHQGTVWGWLIGPFCDAWLRVHPGEEAEIRRKLQGFAPHLEEACIGSISEIFDAEPPYHPRGCIAQAWSVAEVLRILHRTGPSIAHQT